MTDHVEPPLATPARTAQAFSFPYATPYSIQLDLMTALFEAIEGRKVAVLESPTGTGKSLSLICGALSWLRANEARANASIVDEQSTDDGEPAWVRAQAAELRVKELRRHEDELQERIRSVRIKEAQLRKKAKETSKAGHFAKRQRMDIGSSRDSQTDGESDDEAFLPSEATGPPPSWHAASSTTVATSDLDSNLSPAVRALMAQFSTSSSGRRPDQADELPETTPKIIYASRTHSQLSQFVSEIKKTSFGKDLDIVDHAGLASDALDDPRGPIRVIPLGSRKQMCIHKDVQKLGARAGTEAMNEACRELSTASTGKKKRCQYLPLSDELGRAQVLDFRDRAMAQVRDIEDLVELGKEMSCCPYYASRTSARQAELITLPYNLLLSKTARESLGISVKGSVILIDEAHNLIDTILSVCSCSVTSTQAKVARDQISEYLRRFGTRLRGESEMHLKTFRRLLDGLHKSTEAWAADRTAGSEEVWTAAKIVDSMGGNLDTINFAKLEQFLRESQIARKVSGYAERQASKRAAVIGDTPSRKAGHHDADRKDETLPPSAIAAMHALEAFVLSLANRTKDGRVLLTVSSDKDREVHLKYQLLNPSESFAELVNSARAIILAGGTMQPISDVRNQLLPSLPSERWTTFSCGHIVPSSNLFCSVVPSGPRGTAFEFTYSKQKDTTLLDDLGNAIVNISAIVPHGIVVFLPSYKLLDSVTARWKETGLLKRLETRKAVFSEPKAASDVDVVLKAYTAAIDEAGRNPGNLITGSILFAVVGAKLSEGINFSDRLARAVVMVGMPFPNSQSAELIERMNYVRQLLPKAARDSMKASAATSDPGHALYLSLCLKAVNQSIGRAIRHQNDFASLILLDKRYGRKEIKDGLPGWIREQVKVQEGFGGLMKDLGGWWREKRAKGMV